MQQSYAQLKAQLWAAPTAHAYAVINGAVVPGLRDTLAKADVRGWDCLWRGALPPEKAARAPYLAELSPEGAFTDWLFKEASVNFPGWGMVAVGPLKLLAMREHGRALAQVTLPDGQDRRWTWFDPDLWLPLLPKLEPTQLDAVYGVLTDWVVVRAKTWHWLTLSAGQLVASERQCLPDTAA